MSEDISALDLLRLVPRLESAKKRGTSVRTLDKKFKGQFVYVSERRKALPLYLVLGLPRPTLPGSYSKTATPTTPAETKQHVYGVAAKRIGRPRSTRKPELVD